MMLFSLLRQKWNHTVLNGEHTGALSIQSFTAGFSQLRHPSPASYVVPSPTLPTSCTVTIMFSHLIHVPFAHPGLQYSTIHCPLYCSPPIMPKPSDTRPSVIVLIPKGINIGQGQFSTTKAGWCQTPVQYSTTFQPHL